MGFSDGINLHAQSGQIDLGRFSLDNMEARLITVKKVDVQSAKDMVQQNHFLQTKYQIPKRKFLFSGH